MDLNTLNKEQYEAVLYNDGPLLIIAGAGSGKTRVITYKIAYLIENGVDPHNILAITFTNKAANEMTERVNNLLNDNNNKVFISTFHKFCGRVLRAYIETIGYNRNYTIYDSEDQKKLINRIIKNLGFDEKKIKAKAIATTISYCKNHGIDVYDYKKSAKSDVERIYARVFEEYLDLMFKNNAIDFDDMLLLTVRILKENEDARKILSNKFKYILVDEYQDTNLIQFEIIKLLVDNTDNKLTVVGDDDQSIYKFRGADIRNILEFENAFSNVKTIKLTQNYRSTNHILKVANSIIKNNNNRKTKVLWSENNGGLKVEFNEYEDDSKEAYTIINNIKRDNDYKNTAILYRTNAQSRKFEEMCVSLSVPYVIIGGVNFYERREVKDVIAYLNILVNPTDTNSFFRIINVPKRGIGDATLEKILDFAGKNNMTPLETVFNFNKIDLSKSLQNKLKSFVELIIDLKNENEIDIIIEKILKNCYEEFLIEEYGEEEARDRIDNVIELKNKATTFKNVYPEFAENDIVKDLAVNMSAKVILEDFLYEISLVSDTDNLNTSDDRITLMSLHSSKGLEFDTVYLIGMNEGVFPSYQSIMSDDKSEIEEERRLCYVGVTRARKCLFLSGSRRRLFNGQYNNYSLSRFVNEIDDELLNKHVLNNDFSINDNDIWDNGFTNRRNSFFNKKYDNRIRNTYSLKENKTSLITKNDVKKSIDTYKTGSNIEKATSLSYNVGDKVTHIKFGDGEVLKIEDIGRDYEVTVKFDEYGEKVLFAAFAKLEKI